MPLSELENKENALRSGAGWFYWIAGLSIINTILFNFEADISFTFGLGITQIVDGISFELQSQFTTIIAVIINLIIVGLFFFIGKEANERKKWAFILGIVLLILDGLIFVVFEDYFGILFHLFALFMIIVRGFMNVDKINELKAMQEQQEEQTSNEILEIEE